jgi:hypothetical protein
LVSLVLIFSSLQIDLDFNFVAEARLNYLLVWLVMKNRKTTGRSRFQYHEGKGSRANSAEALLFARRVPVTDMLAIRLPCDFLLFEH